MGVLVVLLVWLGLVVLSFNRLNKETKDWVQGPTYFEIMGACIVFFPPIGLYFWWDARRQNKKGTAPKAIPPAPFHER